MDKWTKEFLEEQKTERPNYSDMIDFCCDSLVMNNYIVQELEKNGYYFDTYCGDMEEYFDADWNEISKKEYDEKLEKGEDVNEQYIDIYQYFIISDRDAERLERYTNEIVICNEDLDLYILCVTHFGTCWSSVSADWKDPNEYSDEEEE